MLKVVVTGAFGAIGRYVARRYGTQGAFVVGIGHGAWAAGEWRQWGIAQWHSADITIANLLTYGGEPDVIIHCAGSGSVAFSVDHPYQDFERTVTTTMSVLEFMRTQAPHSRLVYPSSAAVYGDAPRQPIAEDSSLAPVSPYGVHKHVAEALISSHGRQYGLRASVVRLFSIYGEGLRKQLLWEACNRLARGEAEFFGTGEETRDWLHVSDAATLLVQASEHASESVTVANGGSGESVSVRDLLTELFRLWGRSDQPRFLGAARRGDPRHYQAEIKVSRSWGWAPTVRWREGLRRYVEWYRGEIG